MTVINRSSPSGPATMLKSTVTFDFGTAAPGTGSYNVPVPGAQVGDGLTVNPSVELDGNIFLVHFHVIAAGIVHLETFNISGAPIVIGEQPFIFTLFRGQ